MKARVRATGEIVQLSDLEYDVYGNNYLRKELEIIDEPDYWEKLHHQAAISAMQGILSCDDIKLDFTEHTEEVIDAVANTATKLATAFVDKLKNEK